MGSKTKPRKVNWMDSDQLMCAYLASLGMSTKKIMEETGLSNCQITYRLKIADIKRADYRNGESEMAKRIIERMATSDRAKRSALGLEVRPNK